MLDPYVRPLINAPLHLIGKRLIHLGMTANAATILGFLVGILAMAMIWVRLYEYALVFLLLNRFFDGVDGAIARHSVLSDLGGFLDIVCDFIIYAGVVFSFAIADSQNAFAAAFLIFSFVGPITSFLAYAIIAAKKQIHCSRRGKKSFYYLGGICEGTETTIILTLMCLMPDLFPKLCLIYGILCWITTIGRVYQTWSDFGGKPLTSLSDCADTSYKEPAIKKERQAQ